MNKTYKIQLPRNKEAQNIRTNIKDGTIEVEVELKEKWEPRDGEICYLKANNTHVFVFKSFRYNKTGASCYVSLSGNHLVFNAFIINLEDICPATDKEKQQLFDALAKVCKIWDAEKKAVVDLPRWRANKNEHYFHIYWTPAPRVSRATDCCLDCDYRRYNMGNYFKTEEAARIAGNQILELLKKSKAE